MSSPTTSAPVCARAQHEFALEFLDGAGLFAADAAGVLLAGVLLPGGAVARIRGAERELERLHVEELSRLLSQAAELRGRALAHEFEGRESSELSGAAFELAAWRSALADEIRAARLDGGRCSPRLERLLDDCAGPRTSWPSARTLALAAAALHPSARARASLAAVALREGDWAGARSALESALAADPHPSLRARLHFALRELDAAVESRLAAPAL